VDYQLAQVTAAMTQAAFSSARMAGLTSRIEELNRLAEGSPGYVWRMVNDDEPENHLDIFSDYFPKFNREWFFYNLSVWQDVESLRHYVYHTAHYEMLKRKKEWTLESGGPHLAAWWIPAGTQPTVPESKQKLVALRQSGPTREAFNFSAPFPKPGV
jgi:Domain of unknown function (DUF3291)